MAPNALLEGEYERRMNGTVPVQPLRAVPGHRDHRISLADPGALTIDPDREHAIRRAVLDAAPEDIAAPRARGTQ
jgi:hypothetical protein